MTRNELPEIAISTVSGSGNAGWGGILETSNSNGVIVNNQNLGGSGNTFNIMQPYQVVGYMWIRKS